jgi:hypothetical protein
LRRYKSPKGDLLKLNNSFNVNDAIRFKLVTQQEDTSAKIQVFLGVFLGVILRWLYGIAVGVIKNKIPWDFGTWPTIIARVVIALIVTIFVFSGYWQKVKDQPAGMRFLNAFVYGVSIDALVGPWTY